MKSTKTIVLLIVFSLLAVSAVSAKKPPERKGVNYSERELNYIEESADVSLLPDFEGSADLRSKLKDFDPSGVVELLYTMPLPDTKGQDMMLYILQHVAKISTMEGIEYYSGSRKAMYPYLEKNYVVATRRGTKKVDDPVFHTLPDEPVNLYVFQDDTTFSKAWYDVSYEVTGDAIHLSLTNTSVIRYKMFPVMREGRLKIDLIVIPRENDLLFYGSAAFKIGSTFGIDLKLDKSFDHRMSALQVWFSNQCY